MENQIFALLASPLENAISFCEKEQLDYILKEIKPPYQNKDNLKDTGKKRVLKIEKDIVNNLYQITWSFQYNS